MEIVDDKKYILISLEYDDKEEIKYNEMSGKAIKAYFHDLAEQRFWEGESDPKIYQSNDDEYALFLFHVIKGESAAVLGMLKDWSYVLVEKDPAIEGVADYQANRNRLIHKHSYDTEIVNAMNEKEVRLRVWLYEDAPSFANVKQSNQEMAICLGGMDDAVDYLLAHPYAEKDTYYDDIEDTGHYYLDTKLHQEGKQMEIENNKSYILIDLEHQEKPETNFKVMLGSDIIAFFKELADKRLEQSFKSDFPDSDEVLLWLMHASRGEEDAIRVLLDVNEWLYAIVEKDTSRLGIEDYIENRKFLRDANGYEETELNGMSERLVHFHYHLLVDMPSHDLELAGVQEGAVPFKDIYETALYLESDAGELERIFYDNTDDTFYLITPEALAAYKIGNVAPHKDPVGPDAEQPKLYTKEQLSDLLQLQALNLHDLALCYGKISSYYDYCDYLLDVYNSNTFKEEADYPNNSSGNRYEVFAQMFEESDVVNEAIGEVIDRIRE